jgi:hypothetical protein
MKIFSRAAGSGVFNFQFRLFDVDVIWCMIGYLYIGEINYDDG